MAEWLEMHSYRARGRWFESALGKPMTNEPCPCQTSNKSGPLSNQRGIMQQKKRQAPPVICCAQNTVDLTPLPLQTLGYGKSLPRVVFTEMHL